MEVRVLVGCEAKLSPPGFYSLADTWSEPPPYRHTTRRAMAFESMDSMPSSISGLSSGGFGLREVRGVPHPRPRPTPTRRCGQAGVRGTAPPAPSRPGPASSRDSRLPPLPLLEHPHAAAKAEPVGSSATEMNASARAPDVSSHQAANHPNPHAVVHLVDSIQGTVTQRA